MSLQEQIKAIDSYTKSAVKQKRYDHSVRVAQMCEFLCNKYDLDAEKGYLVGIGHDMCKEMSDSDLIEIASRDGDPITDYEKSKPSLLHGRAAAVYMKEKFGIEDSEILEAVANHVSGKEGIGPIGMVLFLSDKIEPSRPQSTDEYRANLFKLSLMEMYYSVIKENYEYISSKGYDVYPGTYEMLQAYDRLFGKGGDNK